MAKRKPTVADRLQQRADEIQRLRGSVEDSSFGGDEGEMAEALPAVDQHPADHSDVVFQRELDLTAMEILDEQARQVQEAMSRHADGTYGICANCGAEIPRERLEARPEATLCIECQRRREAEQAA